MRVQSLVFGVAAALCVGGCATNGDQGEVSGAAIGAAVGGAAGLAGAGPTGAIGGAIVGGIAGAAVGGLVKGPLIKQRQYYRDTRGFCYWIDSDGGTHYEPTVKC